MRAYVRAPGRAPPSSHVLWGGSARFDSLTTWLDVEWVAQFVGWLVGWVGGRAPVVFRRCMYSIMPWMDGWMDALLITVL